MRQKSKVWELMFRGYPFYAKNNTDGQFGAQMSVNIVNDGPVTIMIDSRNTKGGDVDVS